MEEDLQQPQLEVELAPGRTTDEYNEEYERILDLMYPQATPVEKEQEEQTPESEQVAPTEAAPAIVDESEDDVEEQPDDNRLERKPYMEPVLGYLPGGVGDVAGGIQEFVNAPFAGASDVVFNHINAGLDNVQKIGGPSTDFRFKRSPLYEKDWMNSWRDISGSILFEISASQFLFKKLSKLNFLPKKKPLIDLIGKLGLDVGVAASVVATDPDSATSENLFDMVEKWPVVGWATQALRTSPDMTSEQRRAKNILADTVTNSLFSIADFGITITGARRKIRKLSETVQQEVADVEALAKEVNIAEDKFLADNIKRDKQLKDYGDELKRQSPNEPNIGSDPDLFDPEEQVFITSDDDIYKSLESAEQVVFKPEVESQGRLASQFPENTLTKALAPDNVPKQELTRKFRKQITDAEENAGFFSPRSKPELREAALEAMADALVDPKATTGFLRKFFSDKRDLVSKPGLTGQIKVKGLSDDAAAVAFKAMSKLLDKYMSLDTIKAQAYLMNQYSGEVADLATGIAIKESDAGLQQAQELIIRRIQYLMTQKGVADWIRGTGLQSLDYLDKAAKGKIGNIEIGDDIKLITEEVFASADEALKKKAAQSRVFGDTLNAINKADPRFLKSFITAFRVTNGNVAVIEKWADFMLDSTDFIRKGFVDNNPSVPSRILTDLNSILYGLILSGVSPAATAFHANNIFIGMKFAQQLIGSTAFAAGGLVRGDAQAVKELKKTLFAYGSIVEGFRKVSKHTAFVYKEANLNPTKVPYAIREEAAKKLDGMKEIHQALQGEFKDDVGMESTFGLMSNLSLLAEHPVVRHGTNSMLANDGGVRALEAFLEARRLAFDEVVEKGIKDPKQIKKITDEKYQSFFDKNGFIKNDVIEARASEVTLQLDTNLSRLINQGVRHAPVLKNLFRFHRSMAGAVHLWTRNDPMYQSVAAGFQRMHIALDPWGKSKTIQQKRQYLERFRVAFDPKSEKDIINKYNEESIRVLGAVGFGASITSLARMLFVEDRLIGDGHPDPNVRRAQRKQGIKLGHIIDANGKAYDLDRLGTVGDMLRFYANVFTAFDIMGEDEGEKRARKFTYALSAHMLEKGLNTQLSDLMAAATGDPSTLTRIAARELTTPFAPGLRSQMTRIFSPYVREFERDLEGYMMNNFRAVSDLPLAYNPIEGGVVNPHPPTWFERAINEVSAVKVSTAPSEVIQYLSDMEISYYPEIETILGTKSEPVDRSEIDRILGEKGDLKRRLKSIMKQHPADQFKEDIRDARRRAGQKRDEGEEFIHVSEKDFRQVHAKIRKAFRDSIDEAVYALNQEQKLNIIKRARDESLQKDLVQSGVTDITELLDPNRNR
tara:strand:- start:2366 stop:6403 length:4038 start_codon:yes stop_codon:yes gene_type:complete